MVSFYGYCSWCSIKDTFAYPQFTKILFPFKSFIICVWMFKAISELFACVLWGRNWGSFFSIWISSYSSAIWWEDFPFPIILFWHLCQKSNDCISVNLYLGLCPFLKKVFISFYFYSPHPFPSPKPEMPL